jgi:hypothetical protein
MIKKLKNNKYRVYSEKGKNMGTYDSKSKAKDRLRQIEFFKSKANSDDMENDVDDIGVFFEDELPEKKLKVEDLFGDQSTGDIATLNRPNTDGVWYQKNASIKKRSTGLTSMVSYIDRPPDLEEPFSYSEEDDFLFKGEDLEEMDGNKPTINEKKEEDFMSIAKRRFSINNFYKMAQNQTDTNPKVEQKMFDFFTRKIIQGLTSGKMKKEDIFSDQASEAGWGTELNKSFVMKLLNSNANQLLSDPDIKQEYSKNKEGMETFGSFYYDEYILGSLSTKIINFVQDKFTKNVSTYGEANQQDLSNGIPRFYGLDKGQWNKESIEYFKKIQARLVNLKDTSVASMLNQGVTIEALQQEVTALLGRNPTDGKYGRGTQKAIDKIYSSTSLNPVQNKLSSELLKALFEVKPESAYSLNLNDDDKKAKEIYIERNGASGGTAYVFEEYGSGLYFAFGSPGEYSQFVKMLNESVGKTFSELKSNSMLSGLNIIDLEANSDELRASRNLVSGAKEFSLDEINTINSSDTYIIHDIKDKTVLDREGATDPEAAEEMAEADESDNAEESVQQATTEAVTLPDNISSDPSQEDDNNEKIKEEDLEQLTRIFDGLRSGRYDITVRSHQMYSNEMIKLARRNRKDFIKMLSEEKVFDRRILSNYYYMTKEAQMPDASNAGKHKMDRDQIASDFSRILNELNKLLSANGMTSGMKGVVTAVFRYYKKNTAKFGGDGAISPNNVVFFYKAAQSLLERLGGSDMENTTTDFDRK